MIVVVLVILTGVLVWSNYRFSIQSPGGNDFLARWTGAHFWLTEGINPYDEQVSLEAQTMIYGRPADPTRGEDVRVSITRHAFFCTFWIAFFYTCACGLDDDIRDLIAHPGLYRHSDFTMETTASHFYIGHPFLDLLVSRFKVGSCWAICGN
jgi:hypothetical protein